MCELNIKKKLYIISFIIIYMLSIGDKSYLHINSTGVSGGTSSGKTTVCEMIIQQLHDHRVVLVYQVSPLFLSCFTRI